MGVGVAVGGAFVGVTATVGVGDGAIVGGACSVAVGGGRVAVGSGRVAVGDAAGAVTGVAGGAPWFEAAVASAGMQIVSSAASDKHHSTMGPELRGRKLRFTVNPLRRVWTTAYIRSVSEQSPSVLWLNQW